MKNIRFPQIVGKAGLIMGAGLFLLSPGVQAQSLSNMFNSLKNKLNTPATNSTTSTNSATTTNSSSTPLSSLRSTDISSGLKQALEQGAQVATQKLSAKDGFFADATVKILFPPDAQKAANALRSVGLGSLVDDAVLKMNRAAEAAAGKAAPIFIDAIKGITIDDGVKILTGPNDAATQYLETKTTTPLTQAFSPVIESTLGQTGATKAWTAVVNAYNKIPLVKSKINPDLTEYVTQQALKGVFTKIAGEELKIRDNPLGQASSLLQKVFGAVK